MIPTSQITKGFLSTMRSASAYQIPPIFSCAQLSVFHEIVKLYRQREIIFAWPQPHRQPVEALKHGMNTLCCANMISK